VFGAVAFDLDDTLAVTRRDRETLLRAASADADVDPAVDRQEYLDAHRRHSGTESRRPVFEALVEDPGDAADLTRAYRDAIGDAIEPVDDAGSVLETLTASYRLGLLTDGPERTQRDKLRRLDWSDAFDAVVVTGGIDAPKPAPGSFVALADALGVPPESVVYVGDHPDRDVEGAATAGMVPVQVLYDDGPDVSPLAAATIRRPELASLPHVVQRLADRADDA